MNDNLLKVGDFAFANGDPECPRIIVNLDSNFRARHNETGVLAMSPDVQNDRPNIIFGKWDSYYKTQPTKELIEKAREALKKSLLFNNKQKGLCYIDNLTYIEICARLREYEQELTRS